MNGFLDEILLKIFYEFDAKTLLVCSCVSKHWNKISKSQSLWRRCVLIKWPSQFWLYGKAACHELNWCKVYQDLHQYSWYSPDDMKYFISCNTIENELISVCLKKAMIDKINSIKKKWLQVRLLDHDGNMISRHFDQNLELYFNTQALQWVFLDKRRGYMDNLFSKAKKKKILNQSYFIRPYQVIPSCLLMYRWLAIFRSVVTAESGLTFYRIWRFRLKHKDTGFIFEFCDWKAAMSCTFSNGCPNIRNFKQDALELLQILTHPHFIMHPNGLHPRIEKTFLYAIHASAGGRVNLFSRNREKPTLKRRKRPLTPTLSSSTGTSFLFTKQIHEQTYFQDIDERLERWRARRRISLLTHIAPNSISLESQIGSQNQLPSTENLSRGSSYSNLTSEAESATDDSQREFNTSDCDSEFNFHESGFVTNCEYFISDSHNFETVEEQHSQQASVADNWMFTNKNCLDKIPVLYDIDDKTWCIQSQRGYVFPTVLSPQHSEDEDGQQAKIIRLDDNDQHIQAGVENLHLYVPPKIKSPPILPSPVAISPSLYNNLYSGAVEPIPSALALYRLVCLFELNSSMYICTNEDSVWKISMLHKETGGVIHFEDYNGVFQVYVSMNDIQPLTFQEDNLEGGAENMFHLSEFRVSVTELLELLMSENFCHPYGTIAGAVA